MLHEPAIADAQQHALAVMPAKLRSGNGAAVRKKGQCKTVYMRRDRRVRGVGNEQVFALKQPADEETAVSRTAGKRLTPRLILLSGKNILQ